MAVFRKKKAEADKKIEQNLLSFGRGRSEDQASSPWAASYRLGLAGFNPAPWDPVLFLGGGLLSPVTAATGTGSHVTSTAVTLLLALLSSPHVSRLACLLVLPAVRTKSGREKTPFSWSLDLL